MSEFFKEAAFPSPLSLAEAALHAGGVALNAGGDPLTSARNLAESVPTVSLAETFGFPMTGANQFATATKLPTTRYLSSSPSTLPIASKVQFQPKGPGDTASL